ncbi:uncharacterized protein LOC112088226 [Eutrema salsugineum]|uniref:uncharacterized protein LOC112088226 n=1 Tax=Eutrema salsugineum TaxID=72664 RepID=UPI000CED7171|nr:uncharacterized protein LOC112088226 [Eutrema salsugineum]
MKISSKPSHRFGVLRIEFEEEGWIITVDQWKPNPGPDFLNLIPFWIRIKGLPIHLLKKQAIESLISPLGMVGAVELHAKNSDSVEYVRAHAMIPADKPLQFRKLARFSTGEHIQTELIYEKLLKVCFTCRRLTHDQATCPYQINEAQPSVADRSKSASQVRADKSSKSKGKGKEVVDVKPRRASKKDQDGASSSQTKSQSDGRRKGVKERLQWQPSSSQPTQQVWRRKEIQSATTGEGGSTASNRESFFSSQMRNKSSESEAWKELNSEDPTRSGSYHLSSVFERSGDANQGSGDKGGDHSPTTPGERTKISQSDSFSNEETPNL